MISTPVPPEPFMVYHNLTPSPDRLTSLPLDHLSPVQLALYLIVACLTLCVWDWILAFSDELQMLHIGGRRFRYLLDMVYLVVRICPIVYLGATLSELLATTTNTRDALRRVVGAVNIVIMPAASGLFFIRLKTVYSRNGYVTACFGSCWLAILGIFVFDTTIGVLRCSGFDPSECWVVQHNDAWGYIMYIARAAYDTLMYLAISWRLASFAPVDRWQDRLRSFVTGDGLGWLSKVLLQSGQTYYFVTISFNVCTTIFIYSPYVPSSWNSLLLPVNVSVTSVIACRLFRELKLGLFVDQLTEGAVSQFVIRDIDTATTAREHEFELRILDEVDTTGVTRNKLGGVVDESSSDVDTGP